MDYLDRFGFLSGHDFTGRKCENLLDKDDGCPRSLKLGSLLGSLRRDCRKTRAFRRHDSPGLLVTKGFHGIETGSSDRRHHSAYQADDHKDHRCYQDSGGRNQQTDIRGFPILCNRTV